MPPTLSIEDYDTILDSLDTEDTNTILKYFQKYELEPQTELIDEVYKWKLIKQQLLELLG